MAKQNVKTSNRSQANVSTTAEAEDLSGVRQAKPGKIKTKAKPAPKSPVSDGLGSPQLSSPIEVPLSLEDDVFKHNLDRSVLLCYFRSLINVLQLKSFIHVFLEGSGSISISLEDVVIVSITRSEHLVGETGTPLSSPTQNEKKCKKEKPISAQFEARKPVSLNVGVRGGNRLIEAIIVVTLMVSKFQVRHLPVAQARGAVLSGSRTSQLLKRPLTPLAPETTIYLRISHISVKRNAPASMSLQSTPGRLMALNLRSL